MNFVQELIHSNMHQGNDGSNKRQNVLANKIGAILTAACGTATITTSRNMPFGFGIPGAVIHRRRETDDDGDGGGNKVAASNKPTQVHAEGQDRGSSANASASNGMVLSSKRHTVDVASTLSGILTKKWKTSLKRVKVRLRKDVKTKTNAEGKGEMELCKKRILMGEKCRALNNSGVLHYDKHGILLPEE